MHQDSVLDAAGAREGAPYLAQRRSEERRTPTRAPYGPSCGGIGDGTGGKALARQSRGWKRRLADKNTYMRKVGDSEYTE